MITGGKSCRVRCREVLAGRAGDHRCGNCCPRRAAERALQRDTLGPVRSLKETMQMQIFGSVVRGLAGALELHESAIA